jgi:putative SOS response-associated peptidase YedK
MCGRFSLDVEPIQIGKRFGVKTDFLEFQPSSNITPGMMIPIIRNESGNSAILSKWGLVPPWAKDPKIGYKMINARSETISLKSSFRKPFLTQRCLIPATGFYEWKHFDKGKIPYFFGLKNEEIFSFAGLYEFWTDVENRQLITFSIITTSPNEMMQPIHDRMPVILPIDKESIWLDPEYRNPDSLQKLLIPYKSGEMISHPMSTLINNLEKDGNQK